MKLGGIILSDRYVLGCDYGTLSMRAVLVRTCDGAVLAEETFAYPHGVITDRLPESGVVLEGAGWALQDPDDYVTALTTCIPSVLRHSGVSSTDIVAIGIDFTTCTVLPVSDDGHAMCQLPEYRERPHAWVKLWKNHTAYREADDITEYVQKTGHPLLDNYGGRTSSEFFLPKVWEVLRKDPEIYQNAYTFLEAGDFVVYKLCGNMVRSGVFAAAKGFFDNKAMRYPDKEFFRGLDPRLENIVEEKHLTNVVRVGTPAGYLTAEMAHALGLSEDVIVCVSHADAACTLPGAGIVEPNVMTLVMGTSTCHMMMAEDMVNIPGISAAYYEGIIPGFYCYEAGQSAVGDIFDWFCARFVPQAYTDEASRRGMHIMELMNEKASALKIGQSGVLALDWMNGNRNILQDSSLTGLLIGLTLSTNAQEIYRALLEATAFGTKVILDQFVKYHVPFHSIFACGGLAQKNALLMQIYADVLDKPIRVSAVKQTSALASAIFAAVAAGKEKGGYADYREAVKAMVPAPVKEYRPIPENVCKYRELYSVYKGLHDQMSAKSNSAMKQLLDIQRRVPELLPATGS